MCRYLTRGDDLVLTPRFSSTADTITYMSYSQGDPKVYLMNIETGQREIVGNFPGMSFSPRFLARQPARHFQPAETSTILDDPGQYLRAREGECELGTLAIGKRCQGRISATGWAGVVADSSRNPLSTRSMWRATGADGAGFARRYWLSPNSANAWPLQGRIDIVAF
jgi:hypothetical protein